MYSDELETIPSALLKQIIILSNSNKWPHLPPKNSSHRTKHIKLNFFLKLYTKKIPSDVRYGGITAL